MSAAPSSQQGGTRSPPKHTSIIHFHGMGTPKRYEELSRVLDTLDRFVEAQPEGRLGMLRGQTVGLEPCRYGNDDAIAYLKFSHFVRDENGRPRGVGRFRLYESYWSPAAAGGVSSLHVLVWLFARMLQPLTVLMSPWRAHQRLKIAFLNRLFHDRGRVPVLRYQQLASAYRKFEGMGARRTYPRGDYKQFQKYISEQHQSDTQAKADVLALARRWRSSWIDAQLALLALVLTTLAGFAGLITAVAYLGAFILSALGVDWPLVGELVARAGAVPFWLNLVLSVGVVLGWVGFSRFLKLFLADVVFWTTTFEKDVRYRTRREILKSAEDTIRHVIQDPACERIVILGHSLGTAIAYETLLTLGRRLSAEQQSGVLGPSPYEGLRKISHFITLGSPIDRINYFFHLTFSRYHRFNRVADTLLGRSSDLPFQDRKRVIIRWINMRDRSDPIASRLFSPRGPLPNRHEIQEVEVANGHFPDPIGAHTGYFDSALASKLLFDTCVLGRTTIQLQQNRPIWSKVLANTLRRAVWWLVIATTWAIALGGLGYWLGAAPLMATAQSLAFATLIMLVLAAGVGRALDASHSLRLA